MAAYGADCFADNVDNSPWRGNAGRVIDNVRLDLRFHPLRHVALRFGHDHSIVFGNKESIRNVPPKWAPGWNCDAGG